MLLSGTRDTMKKLARITTYSISNCTTSEDFNNILVSDDESQDERTSHSTPKYAKLERYTIPTKVRKQIQLDEKLARELGNQLNQKVLENQQNSNNLTIQERSHSLAEQKTGAVQSIKEQSSTEQPTAEQILTDHVSAVKELGRTHKMP